MHKVSKTLAGASMVAALMASGTAQAGTFTTINIDADFSDWAGVPVLDSDAADNAGFIDFADTQVANDANFLYIRNTYWGPKSLGTFMGIDIDDDFDTGFNIFGLNLIGQDAGWQNDFPFTSGDNIFNDGQGMSGDFFGSGAGLLDQFVDSNSREMAISLDVLLNEDNSALFPDNTIRILFWTDQGAGDVTGVINYTLAVPEPASMALIGLGGLAMLRRR
jgi:PEP-CTERM motif